MESLKALTTFSQTSDELWQGYAAMTAAAYTKDLLKYVPSNKAPNGNGMGLGYKCWLYLVLLLFSVSLVYKFSNTVL